MSYCVNCGVELDESLKGCPLCNTPVVNPNDVLKATAKPTSFSMEKGQVDAVKHKDLAIFLTIVLSSTALTCALLNFLVFDFSLWSFPVIGICVLIWVFAIPAVIYTKLTLYWSFFLDGIAVAAYLYVITYLTADNDWFYSIALPLVILLTLLLEIFLFLLVHFRVSFLATALYVFAEVAIICVSIEILINNFLLRPFRLSWSAVVLTVCVIIIIALITLLSRVRLRNAVRRRLHF